jgi:hypothetical protein
MIIDALIYGMIPRAKIDRLVKAPPENMLNMEKRVPDALLKNWASASVSMPGVGTWTPTL